MTDQDICEEFTSLQLGWGGRKPALNKPLLLLFMLGRCWNNSERLHLFRDIHEPFEAFLREFPSLAKIHPQSTINPFWFLHRSERKIWTLVGLKTIKLPKSPKSAPSFNDAINSALVGGFTEQVYRRIIADKVFLLKIALDVLNKYFPNEKMHHCLLDAIGIPPIPTKPNSFEETVLSKYNYSCSICEFPGTSNEKSADLQVAYIKPVAEGGRKFRNCIAMCDMHSNLFEHGTIAISEQDTIMVSEQFRHLGGMKGLLAYQSKAASFPYESSYQPDRDYLTWHRSQIFIDQRP